ncbi:MAG TPA: LL-diaminopimelate aminotransferase, partial [Methylomirabilota bacterium]|nr:LL-diaminopimelate aminotransferase [Methylomirabilota bacterium]
MSATPSPSPVPLASRLAKLPPYLFAEIDKNKREARARGVDLIDMGIGDPDLPTPPHIIEALKRSAETPANHRYPDYEGLLSFRTAVANWYRGRFGVTLDPQTEVLTLIGSKEGTAHMPLAFVNPGDVVLVPDPGYPVYAAGTWFADGDVHFMPLRRANGFLPDLDAIPADVAKRAKLMYLNYPNNPTAAVATPEFFSRVVDFARRHRIIVCHDAMYSELRFDGYEPPSFLQAPGAREVGVEFHSCSKTYSMTGWRLGFVVGNREVVAGLGRVKTNVDSGAFQAVQEAGIAALTGPQDYVARARAIYQERRDVVVDGLRKLGLPVVPPRATFFVWAPVPEGSDSRKWASRLLQEA